MKWSKTDIGRFQNIHALNLQLLFYLEFKTNFFILSLFQLSTKIKEGLRFGMSTWGSTLGGSASGRRSASGGKDNRMKEVSGKKEKPD